MLERILDAFGVSEARYIDDVPELEAEYQIGLSKWFVSKLSLVYLGNGTTMFGLAFGLWWFLEPLPVLIWSALAMGHVFLCRLYTWKPVRDVIETTEQIHFWRRHIEVSSIVQGLIWGGGAWYFLQSPQPMQLAWVMFVVSSTIAGAVPLMASHPKAFAMFAVPTGLGVVAGLAGGGFITQWMALFFAIFVGISVLLCLGIHRTLSSALRVNIEHAWLADSLREQKDIAEKAVEDKSRFLAAASHDLRQPLSALLLFSEALATEPGKASSDVIQGISRSTRSLRLLMDALMDVSRLDSGNHQPEIQALAVDELFKDLQNANSQLAKDKGLQLEFEPTEYWVNADAVFLRRMLGNLVENAIRYTDAGDVQVSVTRRQDQLMFSVRDTGQGIAEADHKKVFEEFKQLDHSPRDSRRGLGLGLSIVQRLAALSHTEIELQSEPGKGSCFSFTLPMAEPKALVSEPLLQAEPSKLDIPVLILENDADVAKAMCLQLERFGCTVKTATSAASAQSVVDAAGFTPSVILTDYRLDDDSTGVQAVNAVRKKLDTEIPAAIISGDRAAEKAEVKESGLRVLQKPLKSAQLRMVIDTLLKDQASKPNSRAA